MVASQGSDFDVADCALAARKRKRLDDRVPSVQTLFIGPDGKVCSHFY